MLSDEQMSKIFKILPFSLLPEEQMSNSVGVKHLPVDLGGGNLELPPRFPSFSMHILVGAQTVCVLDSRRVDEGAGLERK